MFLFILDSVGTTELLVILGAALIFFGPRRLPQLSRQLGKSLAEFRRASEDFKRTWEREVNLENFEKGVEPSADNSILDKATERIRAAREPETAKRGLSVERAMQRLPHPRSLRSRHRVGAARRARCRAQ